MNPAILPKQKPNPQPVSLPEGRFGSKGELFPPKQLRDQKLEPSSRVSYPVEDGRLIVERIPSLDEVLKGKRAVEISLAEFKRARRELSKRAET